MLGPGGSSMNHKTFGNMIHPSVSYGCVSRFFDRFVEFKLEKTFKNLETQPYLTQKK